MSTYGCSINDIMYYISYRVIDILINIEIFVLLY
jgi:hypothetical protein